MRKKDKQSVYHNDAVGKPEDFQTGRGSGTNEDHNLFAAGSVLGQRINTNTYDSKYRRKKGMRFFTISIAAIFVFAVVFLLVNPYQDITVIYANDSEIIMHRIDVNLFGKYLLKEKSSFDYNHEGLEYGRLKGKSAQIAVIADAHGADIIVAKSSLLLEIGLEDQLADHSHYTGNTRSDLLLRHDLFENDIDLMYGLKAPEVDFIVDTDADAISITSYRNEKEWKIIKHFVDCMYEELDYTTGRIG